MTKRWTLKEYFVTVIKIAAFAYTAPATIAVAQGPLWQKLAGLILIEGALMMGWSLLDYRKQDATLQRVTYAIVAGLGYIGLWWIALVHEGFTGVVFRLTLGGLLLFSVIDSGILATLRSDEATDKNILRDWTVRRHARNTRRLLAKEHINFEAEQERRDRELVSMRREAERRVMMKQLETDTKAALDSIVSGGPRQVSEAQDRSMLASLESSKSTRSLTHANRSRALSKSEAMHKLIDALANDPTLTPTNLASLVGKSRPTVYDYLADLEGSGMLARNGHGYTVQKG
jgi:IclR helix-turn-helix domain